jgi:RES domain-containing protein
MRSPYSSTPFDGEGSRLFGGRWSKPGTRIVYTAEHLSLAILEYTVHFSPRTQPPDIRLAIAEIPDDVSRLQFAVKDLPKNWFVDPAPESLGSIGTEFVQEAKAAILIVPSALSPVEHNWLLNPVHPDFARIRLGKAEPFRFDRRLLAKR